MKNQRFVFGTIVQSNGVLMFQDSNGAMFNIPALNEKGTSLYRRALQASKRPDKFRFKIRVKGSFTSGELCFGRVPASKATDTTPVMNFNKPNGGLEQYAVDSVHKPTVTVVSTPAQTAAPVVMPENVLNFIHSEAAGLKPKMLFMPELKWKYLIRNILRGKNIMMTGAAGCGKTMAAKAAASSLNRPHYYFNLGATQDPRATLIGNTHFNKEKGTFFSESAFVKAISTPNAIILLDEISRAHPEAGNILMSVLDYGQRYLRIDEAEGSPIVNVASGVTFIATANIGNEYTSTRVMDRALSDRFVTIEMSLLDKASEYDLLKFKSPDADDYSLQSLADIAHTTRELVKTDANKISTIVSTRVNVEAAGLVYDGFSLMEAAEIAILPYFSNDGGLDSERTFMKQLVQKFVKTTDEQLYTEPATADAKDTEIVW